MPGAPAGRRRGRRRVVEEAPEVEERAAGEGSVEGMASRPSRHRRLPCCFASVIYAFATTLRHVAATSCLLRFRLHTLYGILR